MVSVIFGNANGTKTNAYIPMSKCQCSDTLVEDYAEGRMATIAKSLVGVYGVQLGLNGDYCETFVHWLAGAADMNHEVYCGSAMCGQAVKYYAENDLYDTRDGSSALIMLCGDIVYYDVQNYGTDQVTAAHAGFVVDSSGNNYIAIEGNADVDAPKRNKQMKVARVIGNRITGVNDKHTRIVHGVGRPFGRG